MGQESCGPSTQPGSAGPRSQYRDPVEGIPILLDQIWALAEASDSPRRDFLGMAWTANKTPTAKSVTAVGSGTPATTLNLRGESMRSRAPA